MNIAASTASQKVPLYTPTLLPPSSLPSYYKTEDRSYFSDKEAIENTEGKHLRLIYGYADSASLLIEQLVKDARSTNRKNKPGTPYKAALAALIANLLWIKSLHGISYGFHRMNSDAFWRLQVGYKPFRSVVEGLEENGYLERERGFKEHTGPGAKAQATRFKATAKLIDLAAVHGITPANWKEHFPRLPRPVAIPDPVILKAESTFHGKGRRMSVDRSDPIVKALAKPTDELNAFLHKQDIQPDKHYGFHRIYANGDKAGTFWDQGARLYSIGDDNYQQDDGDTRAQMTFDGEAVVEIDIKASHVIILHALAKVPLPNNPDPYSIVGFDRDAVKTFVTMTLGYTKFHQDWTADARKGYKKRKEKKKEPVIDLPAYADVKAAVLRAIPLLRDWPNSSIRWGDLQFRESEAVFEAVYTLAMVHGVVALPVHDSIIVPVSQRVLAERVLGDAFRRQIGVRPTLEIKSSSAPA